MKKLLLFFFALLTGVSGAWATTPNILALPQPGKIYYIAGYNSTQNKTAYLYADGTAVKGNISYTKAGDFAYLWLCAKTASGYTFQNLSTGKYIEGPFASGAATRAQLSDNATSYTFTQAVQDANCVSLCANNQWLVVSLTESKAVDRLSGSYNWYSSQWCSDFLLEEYAAKTLSHNQYYYIYCDNDDNDGNDRRQYLYNGTSSTIPVQTDESQVSLTNYAWRAIRYYDSSNPNNDYFFFKNGTKYLGFHSLSESEPTWKWHTNKADGFLTGRVMLWGNSAKASGDRYMLLKYNDTEYSNIGGYSGSKAYYKGNAYTTFGNDGYHQNSADWSQDFIFRVAPQTNVFRVAIKTDDVSKYNPVFTYDGINYSGDCSIYVDKNNMPGTKTITLSSSDGDYIFVGFYKEDGTSLGTSVDVSELAADMGVKAVFIPYKSSSSYETATWYYWTVNGKYVSLNESAAQLNDSKKQSKDAAWAFVRTGTVGKYQIVNASLTSSYYLNFAGVPATMVTSGSFTNCTFDFYNENIYILQDGYYVKETAAGLGVNATGRSSAVSTLEAVDWSELALAEIEPYESILDHYFGGVTTASYNSVKSIAGTVASLSDYNTFISGYSGYLSVKNAPATGYYRIKNKGTNNYLTYGYTSRSDELTERNAWGLSTTSSSTDAASVIKLTGSAGTYKITTQGLNVQSSTDYNKTFPASSDEGADWVFNIISPGIVAINNAASNVDEYKNGDMHEGTGGWNDDHHGVINWNRGADNSKWVVEDATDATIPLNVVDGKSYATMYLPFDATIPSGTSAYTVSISGSRAKLDEIAANAGVTTIPSGTPVLLVNESGAASVVATITSGAAALNVTNDLEGTYFDKTSLDDDEYIFGTRSGELGFWKLGTGHKVGANKAYLVYNGDPSEVKGFTLDFDEIETDIQEVNGEELRVKNEMIFNLAGQRVSKAQKGLYIIGGKKILVK